MVFLCVLPVPVTHYFNKESLNLYSSVYNSLSAIFKNVKPVVGNKLYFIASDKAISLSFCQLVGERHIKNYLCWFRFSRRRSHNQGSRMKLVH